MKGHWRYLLHKSLILTFGRFLFDEADLIVYQR